jgi:hypothetical protein
MKTILIALIAAPLIWIGATRQIPGGPANKAPKDRDTAIDLGVMTEKQRIHSKLYKDYETGKKLTDLHRELDNIEVKVGTPMGGSEPGAPRFILQKFLSDSICAADAVVVAVVKSKSSQLTENETFLFTDYELAVDEVLKNTHATSLQSGSEITITRPGGFVHLDNRKVRAVDTSYQPLETGKQYVFFLRFIPNSGAYAALNSRSSFQVSKKGKIVKLTDEQLPSDLEDCPTGQFLSQVRGVAAYPCSDK